MAVLRAVQGVATFLDIYKGWKSTHLEGINAGWLNNYNIDRDFLHPGVCSNQNCRNFLIKSTEVLTMLARQLKTAFEPVYENHTLLEFADVHLGEPLRVTARLKSLLRIDADEKTSAAFTKTPSWSRRPLRPSPDIMQFSSL